MPVDPFQRVRPPQRTRTRAHVNGGASSPTPSEPSEPELRHVERDLTALRTHQQPQGQSHVNARTALPRRVRPQRSSGWAVVSVSNDR